MSIWDRGSFVTHPSTGIALWQSWQDPDAPALVFTLGFSETLLKYEETVAEFVGRGFNVFIYDHRGMGLSKRQTENAKVVHIEHFFWYAADLNRLMREYVVPKARGPIFLVAHSTGGLIALQYLARYQHQVSAALFSSPLIELDVGLPNFLVRSVVATLDTFGFGTNLALGRGGYDPKKEDPRDMLTTMDVEKARWLLDLFIARPEVVTDGPSNHWLRETFAATDDVKKLIPYLELPMYFLQASEDHYVDTDAQTKFCDALVNCQLTFFPDSRHELFLERDATRQKVWQILSAMISSNLSSD
jgi:lysophospholipase